MNIPYLPIILAIMSTILALSFFRKLAVKINLVDLPGDRKKHNGSVPLIGGLSMFFGLVVGLLILPINNDLIKFLLLSMFTLVAIGSLDDHRNISVWLRFLFQAIAAIIMVSIAGLSIESIGNLNGSGIIFLHQWSFIFSLIAVIGSINAVNMMDGIHGLAGGQSLISFISILFLAFISNNYSGFSIAIVFCAVLVPFMIENLCIGRSNSKRVFMGDAGSMFIGLSVIWLLTMGTQGENASFRPVTALWICAIPLMDMLAIVFRRVRKGKSPFKPDRDHLHHILQRAGLSSRQSLIIITIFAVIMSAIGVLGEYFVVAESTQLALFILIFILYNKYARHFSWKYVE